MSVSRVDARPGAVSLEGSWQELNTPGAFEDTVISPSSTGARLNYDFTGASIIVYGMTLPSTVAQSNAIFRFYIDDSLVSAQSFMLQETRQNNILLFRSLNLPAGPHRLTIQNDSPGSNNAIAVDYFEIADQRRPLISSPSLSISSSSSPTSSSIRNISSSSSDLSSSEASSSTAGSTSRSLTPSLTESETLSLPSGMDPNHPSFSLYAASKRSSSAEDALPTGASATERRAGENGPHLGPIIGGVIGSLALVFLLILLAIYLRKRRRERKGVALAISGDHNPSRSSSPRRSSTHNLPSSLSGSITASPLQTSYLSEKQGLPSSSTDSGLELSSNESEVSPPPLQASHTQDVRSANRQTVHSVQTMRTVTTALPQYELRFSSQAFSSPRPEAPPAYQI